MITIVGPTASGKTQLAVALAEAINGEIISADSRQVYRGMDLGTGKDLADYILPSGVNIPYHLIDICNAGEKYNLFRYVQDFRKAHNDISARGKYPILCGGTGLYVEAVLKDFKLKAVPENPQLRKDLNGKSLAELTEILAELKKKNGTTMHNTTDVDTPKRAIRAIEIELAISATNVKDIETISNACNCSNNLFAINIPRDIRRERITKRLDERLQNGMLDEVQQLLNSGISAENLIYYGLEYKYLTLHLTGELTYQEMRNQLEIAIHQFAKRQMTWFRGMEKRGLHINWINYDIPTEDKVAFIVDSTKTFAQPISFNKIL